MSLPRVAILRQIFLSLMQMNFDVKLMLRHQLDWFVGTRSVSDLDGKEA